MTNPKLGTVCFFYFLNKNFNYLIDGLFFYIRIIRREQEFYIFFDFLSSDSFQMNNSVETVKLTLKFYKFTFGHFNEIREFIIISLSYSYSNYIYIHCTKKKRN